MGEVSREEQYQAYMDAIRRRVCSVCLDQRDDGTCGLTRGRDCGIEVHLPKVVEAILSIESDRMDEYADAISAQVCSRCPNQELQGYCPFRDRGECALSTYLSLVVDAVEEAREELARKANWA